jgi:hypothetical protein
LINIENYATAALDNYTSYVPSSAALANLGGTGGSGFATGVNLPDALSGGSDCWCRGWRPLYRAKDLCSESNSSGC